MAFEVLNEVNILFLEVIEVFIFFDELFLVVLNARMDIVVLLLFLELLLQFGLLFIGFIKHILYAITLLLLLLQLQVELVKNTPQVPIFLFLCLQFIADVYYLVFVFFIAINEGGLILADERVDCFFVSF